MSNGTNMPLYFESNRRQIFGILGSPAAAVNLREGVVICAPAPHEVKKSYWSMRQIEKRLQLLGYYTLRFDYYATGDSEGDGVDYDLTECQKNIQDAVQYLKSQGDVRRVTVLATRMACLLAMKAFQMVPIKKLVLIDPPTDGDAYLVKQMELHRQLLEEYPHAAPVHREAESEGQILGFPHHEGLTWQFRQLRKGITKIKAKSVHLISSKGQSDLTDLTKLVLTCVDEVRLSNVSDDLKWDELNALQFQDFPNELINAVCEAVRGAV